MLPFYSYDEIWRHLKSDHIGFATNRTKNSIPEEAGVYAWILPLRFRKNLENTVKFYKKIYLYDCKNKGKYQQTLDTQFQWQHGTISIEVDDRYSTEDSIEKLWKDYEKLPPEEKKITEQFFSMSSIFNRPLYVGLTNNLPVRHEQHLSSSIVKNNFRSRFEGYCKDSDIDLKLSDLVFCYIPFVVSGEGNKKLSKMNIEMIEFLVKNISNPVFGEK